MASAVRAHDGGRAGVGPVVHPHEIIARVASFQLQLQESERHRITDRRRDVPLAVHVVGVGLPWSAAIGQQLVLVTGGQLQRASAACD